MGEWNQANGKGSAWAPCWSWQKVWSGVPLGTAETSDCIFSIPDAVNPVGPKKIRCVSPNMPKKYGRKIFFFFIFYLIN